MKRILAALAMLTLVLAAVAAFAADYPSHQGRIMVNDFAGTLDLEAKERIENKLRDFEKRTSNQFAVAIVKNMNGETVEGYAVQLFEKWGIGQKGKDNGALLLVAMDERKVRIETGHGIEGELTDLMAGRIIKNVITPAFKNGNFAGGIEKGLDAMMEIATPAPPKVLTAEERLHLIQEAKSEQAAMLESERLRKEKSAKIKSAFAISSFLILIVALLAGAGYLTVREIKKICAERRRIRELKELFATLVKKTKEDQAIFAKDIMAANGLISKLPTWLQGEGKNHLYKTDLALDELKNFLIQAQQALTDKEILVKSERLLLKISEVSEKSKQLLGDIRNLPFKATELKRQVEEELKAFDQDILETEKMHEQLVSSGYMINVRDKLDILKECVKEIVADYLANDFDPKPVINEIRSATGKVAKIGESLRILRAAKSKADTKTADLPKVVTKLLEQKNEVNLTFEVLKKSNPVEIWNDLEISFASVNSKFAIINALLASAKKKSDMKVQQFLDAAVHISKAEEAIGEIENLFSQIKKVHAQVEEAKNGYAALLSEVEQKISSAREKVKDSAVHLARRGSIKNIRSKITLAKSMAEGGELVNWINVSAILVAAGMDADKVYNLAIADISAAAKARAEALRRRQQEMDAEERRMRQAEDDRDSSIYNNNIDSGGGFGGGRSGGGGASGGW